MHQAATAGDAGVAGAGAALGDRPVRARQFALARTVSPYRPAYPLWSDGAEKRRWIELPAGARIDTSNADEWSFPIGTKRPDDTDADLVIGGVTQARGTAHDIPAARVCVGCHGAHRSFVLGLSAVQLSHPPSAPHERTLDDLDRANVLTAFVPETTPAPGSPVTSAALGYLHANCGSCHHGGRPPKATWLRSKRGWRC